MSGPILAVGDRVVCEMARLAALEIPGVLRVARTGPVWRNHIGGAPVRVRVAGQESLDGRRLRRA